MHFQGVGMRKIGKMCMMGGENGGVFSSLFLIVVLFVPTKCREMQNPGNAELRMQIAEWGSSAGAAA